MEKRRNQRATTQGLIIRDNRIFDILILSGGYGIGRSKPFYYRRNIGTTVYTGSVADAPIPGSA